jgi:hypothetical protein
MIKNKDDHKTIIVIRHPPFKYGLVGMVVGFVGIFALSIVLSPLAFIMGVIGFFRGQILSSLFAIFFAILGLITSPLIMSIIGIGALIAIPELSLN